MKRRKKLEIGLMRLATVDKRTLEYVPVIVAARALYLSRRQVLRYFANGDLRGFHVGPGRNAVIKIARSSIIEFAAKHQGRTITPAEIDRCAVE
jgi:hypothetical protein